MIELVIDARRKDLGGFEVGRVLPFHSRRMVGPFIFLDQMGPAEFAPGATAIDVRPHPHIGLSTVSYLLSGAVRHRDNLGSDQVIVPGDVNWMTAGRGIVHSERFDTEGAFAAPGLELLQFWVALPEHDEECAPSFTHYAAADLPLEHNSAVRLRVQAGEAFGKKSPVHTHSPSFYVHAELQDGACVEVPKTYPERAAYIVRGDVFDQVSGAAYAPRSLLVFSGNDVVLRARGGAATIMLFGGEPLGPRFMWWNFVSSRKERIHDAASDWHAGRMPLPENDNRESIPLPKEPDWLLA